MSTLVIFVVVVVVVGGGGGGGVVGVECYCIYIIIIVGVPQPRHSRFVDVECLLFSFSCVPPT
jgi:hypothetical protein